MMKQVILAFALLAVVSCRPQKEVVVTRSDLDDQADGTFTWVSELSDGSKHEQSGKLKQIGTEQGIALTGSYSYTSPEGQFIEVKYIADENGFQPIGDHLPKAGPQKTSAAAPSRRTPARG